LTWIWFEISVYANKIKRLIVIIKKLASTPKASEKNVIHSNPGKTL